jgi:hypothetical protein
MPHACALDVPGLARGAPKSATSSSLVQGVLRLPVQFVGEIECRFRRQQQLHQPFVIAGRVRTRFILQHQLQ